jgi:tetratricopeptide (TPR) repeat protein
LNELQSEEKGRKRRQLAEQAINLAMSEQWQQAIEVNTRLVEEFTPDAEAYNRLGKAYAQFGRNSDARGAYESALKIDPTNTIAQRNITRLAALKDEAPTAREDGHQADPAFFIEETGKTAATSIFCDAPKETLAYVAAGDMLGMRREGDVMVITTPGGERLGPLEGKLSVRLIDLTEGGNTYAIAAISISPKGRELRALVREMRQAPQLAGRVSFPPETGSSVRAYIRGGVIRDERIDDEDEDLADEGEGTAEEEDLGSDALDFTEDLGES